MRSRASFTAWRALYVRAGVFLAPHGYPSAIAPRAALSALWQTPTTGVERCRPFLMSVIEVLESPTIRPLSYVSQKIAHAAAALSIGLTETKEQDHQVIVESKLFRSVDDL
jgi:hypothetical protein